MGEMHKGGGALSCTLFWLNNMSDNIGFRSSLVSMFVYSAQCGNGFLWPAPCVLTARDGVELGNSKTLKLYIVGKML